MSETTTPTPAKAVAKKAAAAKKAAPTDPASTTSTTAPSSTAAPEAKAKGPARGDLISMTAWDPYEEPAGAEVTRHGIVVAVVEDGVRVCWLTEGPTDPIDVSALD